MLALKQCKNEEREIKDHTIKRDEKNKSGKFWMHVPASEVCD